MWCGEVQYSTRKNYIVKVPEGKNKKFVLSIVEREKVVEGPKERKSILPQKLLWNLWKILILEHMKI